MNNVERMISLGIACLTTEEQIEVLKVITEYLSADKIKTEAKPLVSPLVRSCINNAKPWDTKVSLL